MYIEVNNPNDFIRNSLCKSFDNLDITDTESITCIIDSFQYVHSIFPDIYEIVLKTMYQTYLIQKNSLRLKCKLYRDIDQIYYEISEDPYFIIEMLKEVFIFCNKSFLKRRETFSSVKAYKEQLLAINELYVYELLHYTRPIVKEDLLHIYYEEDSEIENLSEFDRFFYAQDKVEDFIYGLYDGDIKNYLFLIGQVIEEGYCFLKNKALIEKLNNSDECLINYVENTTLKKLKQSILEEDHMLSDIVYYFIEFNNLSNEEQIKIKSKIRNKN